MIGIIPDMRFKAAAMLLLLWQIPNVCHSSPKIIITPQISAEYQVDSNYFKSESNPHGMDTRVIKPGLAAGIKTARSLLKLTYSLHANYYRAHEASSNNFASNKNNYIGHLGILKTRTRPFDRVVIGLDDSYYMTRDAARSDIFSESVSRDRYGINRFTPVFFYEFENRFSTALRYRHTTIDYKQSVSENSTEHRTLFDLIYNFTRTALLDVEYQHWRHTYDQASSGYRSKQLGLILKKEYKYVSLEAGGGIHQRDFEKNFPEDLRTSTYRICIKARYPENPEPDPRSYLNVTAERNLNDTGSGDVYFIARRFTLEAGHLFFKKIMTNINGYYKTSYYKTDYGITQEGILELREDTTVSCAVKLKYLMAEGLAFSAEAGSETRESNLYGCDYKNNFLKFTVNFEYDLSSG